MDVLNLGVTAVVGIISGAITAYVTTRLRMREETARWERDLAAKFAEVGASNPVEAERLAAQFAAGFLIIEQAGEERERVYIPLRGVLVVGRVASNDIVIASPNVSRRHFEIRATGDGVRVTDLGSSTGTELNGRRLTSDSVLLSPGDILSVGGTRLTFQSLRTSA
jgi:pSer/pThr/pTyr-binding forkhead associated (FHA) protein